MYVITLSEIDGDFSCTHSVYEDKSNAEFECDILNQLEGQYPNYMFYVSELDTSDKYVDKNQKVGSFYMYSIYTDGDERNPDEYNDDETVLKRYTDKTAFVEEQDDSIIGYSLNNYNEAKQIAFEYYSKNQ